MQCFPPCSYSNFTERTKTHFYTRRFKESQVSPSKSSSCFRISLILGSHVSINFETAGSAACDARNSAATSVAESLILVHVIIHAASNLLRHKILRFFRCQVMPPATSSLSSWRLQCLSLWKRCRHQLGYRRRSSSPLKQSPVEFSSDVKTSI